MNMEKDRQELEEFLQKIEKELDANITHIQWEKDGVDHSFNSMRTEESGSVRQNEKAKEDFWCMEFNDGILNERCSIQCPFCERGL